MGHQEELDRAFAVIYEDLLNRARQMMARERRDHTLQPTALVNEAYLRLREASDTQTSSADLRTIGAIAMYRALVDHARSHKALKRGGGRIRVTLHEEAIPGEHVDVETLDLVNAIEALEALDAGQAKIVKYHCIGGMTMEECAAAIGAPLNEVRRDWRMACAFIRRKCAGLS